MSFSLAAKTVLFIGDSLTAGYGIDKKVSYPILLQEKLAADKNIEIKVLNGSVSGSTSAGVLGRIRWFKKAKPDILVLGLGANDGLRGLPTDQLKANLKGAIQFAKQEQMKVLLLGMQMPPNYGQEYTKKFKDLYFELAKEEKVKLVPFLLDGVAGNKELNQKDGIHPNEKGQEILRDNVYPLLLELLDARS